MIFKSSKSPLSVFHVHFAYCALRLSILPLTSDMTNHTDILHYSVRSTPQDVTSTQVYPGHTLRQVHIIPGRGLYSSSGFTVTSVSWPTPGNAATNSTTNSPSSEYLNSTSWLSKGTQEITTLLGGEDEAAYASPYLTALVVQALQVD